MTVNVGSSGLIQNGVDVVASGGTVNLAAGTYTQGETVIRKSLTLQGGSADPTTVSGNGEFIFNILGTNTKVSLDNLNITNGNNNNSRGIFSQHDITFNGNTSLSFDVLTLGKQIYNGAVTLQGDISLTGNDIYFISTVDGSHRLTISAPGTIYFENTVGAKTPLTSLTITSETTNISPNKIQFKGNVRTQESQDYDTPITLQADVTLTTTEGNITFNNTIDSENGNQSLTVNSSGVTHFKKAVGGATALNSLTTDAIGTTKIKDNIATIGNQTYNDAVTLQAEVLNVEKSPRKSSIIDSIKS